MYVSLQSRGADGFGEFYKSERGAKRVPYGAVPHLMRKNDP